MSFDKTLDVSETILCQVFFVVHERSDDENPYEEGVPAFETYKKIRQEKYKNRGWLVTTDYVLGHPEMRKHPPCTNTVFYAHE